MNRLARQLLIAAALAVACAAPAFADDGGSGDGGDNGMSAWVGDSYAAFNGATRGRTGFVPLKLPAPKPEVTAKASAPKPEVTARVARTKRTNPFRDDQAG